MNKNLKEFSLAAKKSNIFVNNCKIPEFFVAKIGAGRIYYRSIVFCSRNDFQHQTESLRALTVSAAGYIAAADAEGRGHLALGLRQAAG